MLYRVHSFLILFWGPPKNCFICTVSSVGGIYSLHDLNQWLAMEKFLLSFCHKLPAVSCVTSWPLSQIPLTFNLQLSITRQETAQLYQVDPKLCFNPSSFHFFLSFGSHFNRKPNGTYLTSSPIITSISSL